MSRSEIALLLTLSVLGSAIVTRYCMSGSAPPPRGLSTEATIVDWYDGDTVTVDVKFRMKVRLLDCWAPEVRGAQKQQGIVSRNRVRELAPANSKVRLFIPGTGKLHESFTFGRALGRVWYQDDQDEWHEVSEKMVAEGLATKTKAGQ